MAHFQAQDASSETTSPGTDALADPQRIVDTLHEPLLVVGTDLTVRQVNPAFYRVFSTAPDDTIGASLYEMGGGHDLLQERTAVVSGAWLAYLTEIQSR